MKKKVTIFMVTGLVTTLAFSSIAPGFVSANTSLTIYENTYTNETDNNFQLTEPRELDKIIKEENISIRELIIYGNFVKAEISQEATDRWKGAVVKKAVKYMVDHSDIIPSKSLRDIVDKYGSKIINAIDTSETYTWYGIAKALTKAGVPDKYADAIADFIVKFLL